ncbi:CDP-glycerol glycerophosphotransferase family protein [Weissella viridescens]|uniref:CDP-glycerol glycerophosphotransferase family protein n=1 Tax=Weissella viridescens TaxID=1629 RepID=UPI002574BDCD|nr:CDP-glycerol glycerophosphotransferase family protein [Weissella viridescens]WJI90566.1 CDP-glycerol glycerophosphotransferase family protein [Weissella viridescens]
MKLWLFGTYKWQGNPKALLMYMQKHNAQTHEVWWIADTKEEAQMVARLGYKATYAQSNKAEQLFKDADVYVTENFRESYPASLNEDAIILNLWHGVGLKHIELGLGPDSTLAESIVRKYARNYALYRNNLKFLATSPAMESHFEADMGLTEDQIIRGGYPRNSVYREPGMRTDKGALDFIDDFDEVYLFAPTYRFTNVNGSFKTLLPDLGAISEKMAKHNSLFILKLHPFMLADSEYLQAAKQFADDKNIYFWNDQYDVYEIFDKITVGVVDYSSIFYDLLESGVSKFIRYIPDYEQYVNDSELIGDYFELTGGDIVMSFEGLLQTFDTDIEPIQNKSYLMDYFFKYEQNHSIEELIRAADDAQPKHEHFPELHTFDIFDTLIQRDALSPDSIFAKVQSAMVNYTDEPFSSYLLENYTKVRKQVEADERDVFRKTTYERDTDKIEVTLQDILGRLQANFNLSDAQVQFLAETEAQYEIDAVQPIQKRIDLLFKLKEAGNDVMLISDMYLPEHVIRAMVTRADSRLADIPMYVSSSVGYQKSTGRLFSYIFFDIDYHYQKWVHYGDNKEADGTVPRRLGIQTYNHDMADFVPNERYFVDTADRSVAYDAYRLATLFERRRWELIDPKQMQFDAPSYYAYSFVGPTFVPYVNWALRDAIERGYQTVYFISRDGYYLKQIADVLIETEQLPIKAKFIYGSRKAWRVASFIDEVDPASFTPFGMFTVMDDFDDMVKSSQLPEEELLQILPELEGYRNEPTLTGDIAVGIREIFSQSEAYKNRLLEIAAERRPIVTDYLKQEINFDEKFAFIEFWGRGYTQDTLTRLLKDAAGKDVPNPFYYVRNFTETTGESIRHRFTQMPANFSDFESIFATTPYESIPGYKRVDGRVEPIFIPKENDSHQAISENIERFAKDYAELNVDDPDRFDRFVGESEFEYYFRHPFDPYISSVFAQYKDNLAMYGKARAFAPVLTRADVTSCKSIEELRTKTKNIGMSLCQSPQSARDAFKELQIKEGVPVTNIPAVTNVFPINNLNQYIKLTQVAPFKVELLKTQYAYAGVKWVESAQSKFTLEKGSILTVDGVDWNIGGVPRLRTSIGYISANKGLVRMVTDANVAENIVKNTQPSLDLEELKIKAKKKVKNELRSALNLAKSLPFLDGK